MTEKQIFFCKEYIIDLNATKSAIRSGYSPDSAKTIAHELLAKEEVQSEIQRLCNERAARLEISSDDVLREFHSIGMSNIKDFVNGDFEVRNLDEVDFVKAKAIKSIKKTVTEGDFGVKTVVELQLHDKVAGLSSIGKHIGFFATDNAQKATSIQLMVNDPLSNDHDEHRDI